MFIKDANEKWKDMITKDIEKRLPHFIILEFYDKASETTTNKPRSFFVNGAKYSLDSCVIRDTTQQHFCATLICCIMFILKSDPYHNVLNKNHLWHYLC